jgi:hypothetical protein
MKGKRCEGTEKKKRENCSLKKEEKKKKKLHIGRRESAEKIRNQRAKEGNKSERKSALGLNLFFFSFYGSLRRTTHLNQSSGRSAA